MSDELLHHHRAIARYALCEDAQAHKYKLSRDAWQERAMESDEGKLLTPEEIDAIGAMTFGKTKFRAR